MFFIYDYNERSLLIMTPQLLLQGFAIVLFLQWLATLIIAQLGISFPAPLLGMLLLFLLLHYKVIPLSIVEGFCDLLISKMGILFLPAAVGIILYLDLVKAELVPFLATVILGSLVILLGTAKFTELLIRLQGGKR